MPPRRGSPARVRTAEHAAQTLDRGDPAWHHAMDEVRAIFATALAAASE